MLLIGCCRLEVFSPKGSYPVIAPYPYGERLLFDCQRQRHRRQRHRRRQKMFFKLTQNFRLCF